MTYEAWNAGRLPDGSRIVATSDSAEADKTKAGGVANLTDEQILACNNTAAEDQEFSPCITAPDEDLIAFARQVLAAAGMSAEGGEAKSEPQAWQHEEDPDRVISAAQKTQALKDGGASASSVKPYSIALFAASPKAGESRTETAQGGEHGAR